MFFLNVFNEISLGILAKQCLSDSFVGLGLFAGTCSRYCQSCSLHTLSYSNTDTFFFLFLLQQKISNCMWNKKLTSNLSNNFLYSKQKSELNEIKCKQNFKSARKLGKVKGNVIF